MAAHFATTEMNFFLRPSSVSALVGARLDLDLSILTRSAASFKSSSAMTPIRTFEDEGSPEKNMSSMAAIAQ